MALRTGVDPVTFRSTGGCSTVKLPKHALVYCWRSGMESNHRIRGLQPLALPLGYLTV